MGESLFVLAHLRVICPIVATHPCCIFPSLVDDTHIIGLALYVVPTFLQFQEELSTLSLLV
jgi:hypothetical protein